MDKWNAITLNICYKCGEDYILNAQEMNILPNITLNTPKLRGSKPNIILDTWADWIDHISYFCPNCRYEQPPKACQIDWAKHQTKLRKKIESK